MRKSFKPYLRHPLSKKPTVTGPSEPEEVEVTILPQWDTVLRYDGSPLMVEGTVNDPKGLSVVRGENQNYNINDENGNERDWIAIGLATDNQPIDEFRSPKEHPDADDGDPNNDGVVYTNIGPTRSVLSFNLEDVPAGAEILSAVLELVPVAEGFDPSDDVWDEVDDIINVWPNDGVQCEILNLVEQTEETCTWNTTNHLNVPVDGVNYPSPDKRWYRQESSEIPPNPIGAAQNSKRWDIQEPGPFFLQQYSGADGNDIADANEFYGHIGYGFRGGGAVENVPRDESLNVIQEDLSPFTIEKVDHDNQDAGQSQSVKEITVTRAVKYAHAEQNRICNLLLRASHWNQTDLFENQLDLPFVPNPLSLTTIILEDSEDQDTDVQLDHDAIIRFIPSDFDQDGDGEVDGEDDLTWVEKAAQDGWTVNYDWQVKYPPILNLTYDVFRNGVKVADQSDRTGTGNGDLPLSLVAGDVLTVGNISSDGGFENEHIFEFYVDEVGNGLGNSLTIAESDIPEGPDDPSLTVDVFVGARAQGANTGDGDNFFPQTFSSIIGLGFVENDTSDDDELDAVPIYSVELTPTPDAGDDFGSPIDLDTPHTVHVKFTIENIRPGFDWTEPDLPITQIIYSLNGRAASITQVPAQGSPFSGTISNDEFKVGVADGLSENTATNEYDITFTGQEIIDDLASQIEAGDSLLLTVSLSYTLIGTDPASSTEQNPTGTYVDSFQSPFSSYTFSIAEENTEFTAKITEPSMRRGVFTTTNLRGPLRNRTGGGQSQNLRLTRSDSFAKTNMFQRELAPCQLDCGANETVPDFPLKTALLPIEEQSRFSDITATKNKFALLDLIDTQSTQLTLDESDIRDGNGNVPEILGNEAAVVSLVTSGGAGAMVTRRRNGVNIVLPSDLAVYYYNDNEDENDIGWVYYRAVSKKLTHVDSTNDILTDAFSDYTLNDFDVTNTDDGLKFIGWEKLSGDSDNLINNITANLDDPNIGAHLFLLDNRYDFVQTPTDLELKDTDKWPVPFTPAFPLGRVGGTNTPDEPTGLEARNNPSLFETFPEGEGVNVLSELSSVLSVVEWKINSLDSGTSEQQNPIANPSLIRTIEGAVHAEDADGDNTTSDNVDLWEDPCPVLEIVGTRDTVVTNVGQVQPLPDDKSLFVSLNSVDPSGNPIDGENGIEFRTFHDDPDTGLGLFRNGINSGVPTGAGMDSDIGNGEYCNLKSHFWNGLAFDIAQEALTPFTTNNSGLAGPVALFWRRKDDCGLNNPITGDRYFKDTLDGANRVSSDLDRPFKNSVSETDAYHGINIGYGQFHEDYLLSQRDNDTPVLEYIVEVIRGGSVYHRDIYRLANAQTEWSKERTVAGECFPCLRDDRDITESCSGNAVDASGGDQGNKADTLYQVGTEGDAWTEGWYNPSDWRAGDIIRIYAIQPRIVGDEVFIAEGEGNDPDDIRLVGRDIEPTPDIQRIKKFCPVGVPWNCTVTQDPCCSNFNGCSDDTGRLSSSVKTCCDGTVCVVSCSIPGLGSGSGIDDNTTSP